MNLPKLAPVLIAISLLVLAYAYVRTNRYHVQVFPSGTERTVIIFDRWTGKPETVTPARTNAPIRLFQ